MFRLYHLEFSLSYTESCALLLAGNLLCYSCSLKVTTIVQQMECKRMGRAVGRAYEALGLRRKVMFN